MKALLFSILILIVAAALPSRCHYSCASCTALYYTQCLSCSNPSSKVSFGVSCSTNEDQNILSQIGGFCGSGAYSNANPIGIILIILTVVAAILFQSYRIFFFMLSLQALALVSLVEISFPSHLQLLLDSLQYLMLFSVMQRNAKPPNCKLMLRRMYRINDFLGTSDLVQNSVPLIPLAIIATTLLCLALLLIKYRKISFRFLSQDTWNKILHGLRAFLLMTIQEAMMIIYVGIRFSSLGGGLIFAISIYCLSLICLIVDFNVETSLPFFNSVELMNLNFVKKLVLPVLVAVPHNYTFCLLIFMLAFNLISLLFLLKTKKPKLKEGIYLGLQLLCIAMLGGFAIADLGNNSEGQASALAILATIALAIYYLAFVAQIIQASRKKLRSAQIINTHKKDNNKLVEKNAASQVESTISDINSHQMERQTKVTPVEFAGGRKGSDELKVTKHRLQEMRVEEIN